MDYYMSKNFVLAKDKLPNLKSAAVIPDELVTLVTRKNEFGNEITGYKIQTNQAPWYYSTYGLFGIYEIIRMNSRKTLMIALLAKAVCRMRGHNNINNHYVLCRHFDEFREAFRDDDHVATVNSITLAKHWTEELDDFQFIARSYVEILREQFNREVLLSRCCKDHGWTFELGKKEKKNVSTDT